jgi:hypothetical protein
MYLQRLIEDDKTGFNYDYMGRAEYEFGATMNARKALAAKHLDGEIQVRILNFIEIIGKNESKPVEVAVLAPEGTFCLLDIEDDTLRIKVTGEPFRTASPNIIGWMNIEEDDCGTVIPMLMVRTDADDISNRIEKFTSGLIRKMREERNLGKAA